VQYVIEAEVRIEFKRLVDRFDYKHGEEFDGFKYEPVQDAAKRYSDEEDRFLKMFDYAMDRVNETIWAVDNYLKLYTGRVLEECFTVNFAGLDYVKLNRESVVLNCDDNIYAPGTTDICAEGMALAAIEAEYVSDCDKEFVRNYAQKMLTGLINKAIDSSRSYGAFVIKEPEFDTTIVAK
jgi:hypothetical protein